MIKKFKKNLLIYFILILQGGEDNNEIEFGNDSYEKQTNDMEN